MMRRKVAAGVDKLTDIINDEVIAAGGAAEAWGNVPSAVPADDGVCPICGGSGFVLLQDGTAKRCACYAEQRLLLAQKEARLQPNLRRMSFANFDLACYPSGITAPGGKGQTYYQLAREAREKTIKCCQEVIKGGRPRGLLLLGQVGSGKTHLAAAAANQLLRRGKRVLFLVVPDFLDELRNSFGGEGAESQRLLDKAKRTEVLVLDDLGTHNMSDWTRSVLFSVLNYRVNEGLTTIATSNLDFAALQEQLGTRSLSRLLSLCEPCLLVSDCDIRLRGLEKA